MSFIVDATAACPTCGAEAHVQFPASINADRRPDLRAAILDHSLFTHPCRSCGENLTFEPQMTYLDVGRRQWILADATNRRAHWEEAEGDAVSVYDFAFGAGAPAAARAIGAGLVPRLVFGWAAMAEKLLCQELGLDDIALEALKLAAIADGRVPKLDPNLDLRLAGEEDGMLLLHWIEPEAGGVVARMRIPRAAYVLVKGGGAAWAPLMAKLAGQMFVDIGRVLRAPAIADAA